MVLTMLTVFALVSTTGHLLQQKTLAAGMDRAHALQTAERALAWGQKLLQFPPVEPCTLDCGANNLVWSHDAMPAAIEEMDDIWWQQYALEFGTDPRLLLANPGWSQATRPPRIVIEQLHRQDHEADDGTAQEVRYYGIYANGYAVSHDNHAILASTVAVPFTPETLPGDAGQLPISCAEAETVQPELHCGRLGWRELL
jgi:Tfp pilus assembly protein PilX